VVLSDPAVAAPPVRPGRRHGGGRDAVDAYVAAYAGHRDRTAALDRLTAETWLLARSRRLHAAFLAREGRAVGAETTAHLQRLERLVEQAFLALRRVQRGRPEPERLLTDLAGALHADREVFGDPENDEHDPLRRQVTATVAGVLDIEPADVVAVPSLTDLPGFASFQVVEIVEALEERLGVEFDPEDLLPENLHRIDDLCRLAASATAVAAAAAPAH
jgi:acyl carrier protein